MYKGVLQESLPSRTTVQVAKLFLGAHIAVSAIVRK